MHCVNGKYLLVFRSCLKFSIYFTITVWSLMLLMILFSIKLQCSSWTSHCVCSSFHSVVVMVSDNYLVILNCSCHSVVLMVSNNYLVILNCSFPLFTIIVLCMCGVPQSAAWVLILYEHFLYWMADARFVENTVIIGAYNKQHLHNLLFFLVQNLVYSKSYFMVIKRQSKLQKWDGW